MYSPVHLVELKEVFAQPCRSDLFKYLATCFSPSPWKVKADRPPQPEFQSQSLAPKRPGNKTDKQKQTKQNSFNNQDDIFKCCLIDVA